MCEILVEFELKPSQKLRVCVKRREAMVRVEIEVAVISRRSTFNFEKFKSKFNTSSISSRWKCFVAKLSRILMDIEEN